MKSFDPKDLIKPLVKLFTEARCEPKYYDYPKEIPEAQNEEIPKQEVVEQEVPMEEVKKQEVVDKEVVEQEVVEQRNAKKSGSQEAKKSRISQG